MSFPIQLFGGVKEQLVLLNGSLSPTACSLGFPRRLEAGPSLLLRTALLTFPDPSELGWGAEDRHTWCLQSFSCAKACASCGDPTEYLSAGI